MGFLKPPFSYCITFLLTTLLLNHAKAAIFDIRNNCGFTIWAAALPGGGSQLNSGQTWSINVAPGTAGARIWGRTGCSFDGAGRGRCETGDCGGLLQCQVSGAPPHTIAEFALNQFNNLDFFDISLVDGFNLQMEFVPTSGGCTRGPRCTADINGQCPNELRVPGGCRNPCCNYAGFFKDRCPDAFSYPDDHQGTDFTCPGGTNYRVVFCP